MGTSTTATSSTAAGGGFGWRLCLPSRAPIPFVGLWAWATGPVRGPSERAGHVSAAAAASSWREDRRGEQDHYEVLGLPRSASNTEIKRAYRILARKYHPDVNKNLQAGEVFKSIRYAYEVLSDEDSRTRYDMKLRFVGHTERTWRTNKSQNFEDDERKRIRRWAELKQRMWNERQNKAYSQYYKREQVNQESSHYKRSPFMGMLRFTFLILLLMKTIGYQASLTICSAIAFLDNRLDAGYKTGYLIAWFMGGQAGIMLSILICFASWLCGKNSSSLVAVVVIAMWIGSNLARVTPLPQGAVLALLYMSIKLQADLK